MKCHWCNELVGWFWSPFKWSMRCTPTRNEQCIIEEEKTEITGMFIEPGLKKRKSSLVLHTHTYVLCYTLHHLYLDKLIIRVFPHLRPLDWLFEVLYYFLPVWIVPLSVRPVMGVGLRVPGGMIWSYPLDSIQSMQEKMNTEFSQCYNTSQVKAVLVFCVWCT